MIAEKGTCSKCGDNTWIVNRTHKLCDNCNSIRLYGKSTQERTKERIQKAQKSKIQRNLLGRSTSGRHTSTRTIQSTRNDSRGRGRTSEGQRRLDQLLSETVQRIKETREPMCESCGKWHTQVPLSVSHIISRKRCKEIGKPELIYDERNLLLECFGAPSSFPTECHNQHELHNLSKIKHHLTYEYKVNFIRQEDPQLYNILTTTLE